MMHRSMYAHRRHQLVFFAMSAIGGAKATAEIITLHGGGTTNPSKLFWQVADLIEERARLPLHITYRAVGSSTGQKEFVGCKTDPLNADGMCTDSEPAFEPKRMNDFGAGDIPMTNGRWTSIQTEGRKVVHVPFALGGIGVFHSVPASTLGGKPLELNGCLLAKIFSRQITKWDDPEIKALNPDMTATEEIMVVHRKKGSSSTSGFTEYLDKKCPSEWSGKANGCGATGCLAKSTITWPADTAVAEGSGGMSAYIKDTPYAIGYIDAGHGHDAGLGEIALENKDGFYLTTKQADISAAATVALAQTGANRLIPENPEDDWSTVNLYDLPGATTWPITMISYFYLEQDMSSWDADTVALLMYFVKFVIGAEKTEDELLGEGQMLASNTFNMFEPLPSKLVEYNALTLAGLSLPADFADHEFHSEIDLAIITGAQDRMISKKRRSYAELERGRTSAALDAYIADDSVAMGTIASNATQETVTLPFVGEQELADLATAGLALGVLGFVFGLIALIVAIGACMSKSRASQPRSQEIPVRNLDVPKSAV